MALLDDISVSEIKQMMEHEHLTQAEVAKRLDVSQSRISALIGVKRPTKYTDFEEKAKDLTPKQLAEYYGTSVGAIYQKMASMRLRAKGQHITVTPEAVKPEPVTVTPEPLELEDANPKPVTVTPPPEAVKPVQWGNDKPLVQVSEIRVYTGRSGITYTVNGTEVQFAGQLAGGLQIDDLAGLMKELNQVYSMEVKKGERV